MNDNNELTPKQKRVIPYLVAAPSIEEGCKRAYVGKATAYGWLKDKAFSQELKRQQDAVIHQHERHPFKTGLPKFNARYTRDTS